MNIYFQSDGHTAISTLEQFVIPSLYFILFVFGFIGNSVVVYVSCFLTRRSKNAVSVPLISFLIISYTGPQKLFLTYTGKFFYRYIETEIGVDIE